MAQPLRRTAPAQAPGPSGARGSPVRGEIATLERDYSLFAGYFKTLQNPDKVLRLEAAGDLSVYDDLGRDPHIASVLRTRALAVVGKEWEVVPASEKRQDVKIAEFLKEIFLSFPFDLSRRALLRGGLLKGYAVGEVLWEVSEGQVGISTIVPRAQRRFRFGWDGRLRLLTQADMVDGEALPERKFQIFTFGDEPETPYGVGLARELYWPWWFKKHGIKFWLVFADKFGQPTPWGKYPPGTSEADQAKLLDALGAMQTDGAVITPDSMSVELLEAARSGSIDTYERLCDFMNDEISKAVLGQTATVSGTPGKLGSEDAQENVRLDLVKADADALCEALNAREGVIRWLVDYNFGPQQRYPKMWIRCDEEDDQKLLAERDEILARLAPIGTQYIYDTYGIPKPAEGEELVWNPGQKPGAATAPEAERGGASYAERSTPSTLSTPAPESPTALIADRLADEGQSAVDAWISTVQAMVERAESLEELREWLLAAYGDLPTGELARVLAAGLTAAAAAGRFDAAEDGDA